MMATSMTQAPVTWLDDSIEVQWGDGSASRLPYLWLRDNCDCADCRISQTSEKRFLLSAVPVDIRPSSVALIEDELRLVWPDGHRSRYAGIAIRALNRQDVISWTPWGAEFEPMRCDYRQFLGEDAAAAAAIETFLTDGAMLLIDAPTSPGTLESLAPRLGPVREVLFARIHDVEVDESGYNVAHTSIALPPHNDFASYSWPPSVQALHMLANETPGGESIIVDGWRVVGELRDDRPALFHVLCSVPVPFREFDDANETFAAAPLIRLDVDGNVTGLRFSNQLMQAIPPNRDGVAEFYSAYHELCRRVTDPAGKATFRLDAGQILVVASHRVLHAREAFEPVGRRHLQDAYFEHDNVRNHLVVLRRRLSAEPQGDRT